MRKFILVAFAASLLVTNPSHAGFLMKKQPTVAVESVASGEATIVTASAPGTMVTGTNEAVKKQSVFSKLFSQHKGGGPEISKPLYVVLAIIGFGWLAMGINDNFEDWDWVISLILYIILWLPGLIYTLVKMKKYYK